MFCIFSRSKTNRPFSNYQLPLITMTLDSLVSFNFTLNIHKFQCGYDLFTTLCIVNVGDSDLAGIEADSTPN